MARNPKHRVKQQAQPKTPKQSTGARPCPNCGHRGRMSRGLNRLFKHDGVKCSSTPSAMGRNQACNQVHTTAPPLKDLPHQFPQSPKLPARTPTLPHEDPAAIQYKYGLRYPGLPLQRDLPQVPREQLAQSAKSIHKIVTAVENECIQIRKSEPDQWKYNWREIIDYHQELLDLYHNFFLTISHPSGSPDLPLLAKGYSMPERMWKHGIDALLRMLQSLLPGSFDHMLAFLYFSYQTMASLFENVPAFEDTWIECLGDLARYRMAIEFKDAKDREIWASVASLWYNKAADNNPSEGRLYHHLAILARFNPLQQLYYYARSLTSERPFLIARESILNEHPVPEGSKTTNPDVNFTDTVYTSFIRFHTTMLRRVVSASELRGARIIFQSLLNKHIHHMATRWRGQGIYIAVANIASLFEYGNPDSILRQVFILYNMKNSLSRDSDPPTFSITNQEISDRLWGLNDDFPFCESYFMTMDTLALALRRTHDGNVVPHVHVLLSFFAGLAHIEFVTNIINAAPWIDLVYFLNTLLKNRRVGLTLSEKIFPETDPLPPPLPEDYLLRGQIWTQWYFPQNWFENERENVYRYQECPYAIESRAERVMRLGYLLSTYNRWISYDTESCLFTRIYNRADYSMKRSPMSM